MEQHNLSVKGLAWTAGTMWKVYLFFAAIMAGTGAEFIWFSNSTFSMLAGIYHGLAAGFAGAVSGLIYGFICGGWFVVGFLDGSTISGFSIT